MVWRRQCGSLLVVLCLRVPFLDCLIGIICRCKFLTLLCLLHLRLCPCLCLRPHLCLCLCPCLRWCQFCLCPHLQLRRFFFHLHLWAYLHPYRFGPLPALLHQGSVLCLRRLAQMRMRHLCLSLSVSILHGLLPPPPITNTRLSCLLRSGTSLTPPNAMPWLGPSQESWVVTRPVHLVKSWSGVVILTWVTILQPCPVLHARSGKPFACGQTLRVCILSFLLHCFANLFAF